MAQYESNAEIIKRLGLSADASDPNEIRRELKLRISELHPDRRSFIDDRFRDLSEALKDIQPGSTQLALRDSTIATHDHVSLAISIHEEAKNIGELEKQAISSTEDSFRVPHISLATASAVVGFLWLIPKKLEDQPILSKYSNHPFIHLIWGVVFFVSLLMWVFIWLVERRKKMQIRYVLSAAAQQEALNSFAREDEIVFSAQQYREILYPRRVFYSGWFAKLFRLIGRRPYFLFEDPTHDPILAEQAARLGLERALAKKWIAKCRAPQNARTADDWFMILRDADDNFD
jgi:hypothetical protein